MCASLRAQFAATAVVCRERSGMRELISSDGHIEEARTRQQMRLPDKAGDLPPTLTGGLGSLHTSRRWSGHRDLGVIQV